MHVWPDAAARLQTATHCIIRVADHDECAIDRADDLALTPRNRALDVVGVGGAFGTHRGAVAEVCELLDRCDGRRFGAPLRSVSLDDESKLGPHFKRVFLFESVHADHCQRNLRACEEDGRKWTKTGARGSGRETILRSGFALSDWGRCLPEAAVLNRLDHGRGIVKFNVDE